MRYNDADKEDRIKQMIKKMQRKRSEKNEKNWENKEEIFMLMFSFLLATSMFDLMSDQTDHFKSVLTWSDYFSFFLILMHSWSLFSDFLRHFQWTWIL